MRLCQCGCGEEVTNNRWKFKRRHAPQHGDQPAAQAEQLEVVDEEQSSDEPEESHWTLSLTLSDSQIEFLWQTLTPQERATAIQYALENR